MLTLRVDVAHLVVERPEVVEPADKEQTASEEPNQPCYDLAHVEAVDAEHTEEHEKEPGDVVVGAPGHIAPIGAGVHRRNQEEVDNPADEEHAAGEEPD